MQGDISEAASDGNAEQNNVADVAPDGSSGQNDISDEISNEEELQQDMQGGDSLEKKRKRMQLRLMCFRMGRVQIL